MSRNIPKVVSYQLTQLEGSLRDASRIGRVQPSPGPSLQPRQGELAAHETEKAAVIRRFDGEDRAFSRPIREFRGPKMEGQPMLSPTISTIVAWI